MHEKRQQLRFSPGYPLKVELMLRAQSLTGWVEDFSAEGCRIVFPPASAAPVKLGMHLNGAIDFGHGTEMWQGPIIHRRPTRGGIGFGVRFCPQATQTSLLGQAIQHAMKADKAGALRLKIEPDGLYIALVGYFGFGVDRDFLSLVRREPIRGIDLSACRTIDSAGLGLLAIAHEAGIPLGGAQGKIAELLQIARLVNT